MPKPATPAAESLSFEGALKELETITAEMEAGSLPLEDSLKSYQRGVELIKAAHARLASVEEQVKVLEDGVLKPLKVDEA
jgi:exodeoxyribonuclease VII small subunit